MPVSFKSKLFAFSIALLIHASFIVTFTSSQQGLTNPNQAGVQITFSPPPSINTVNAEKAVLDEVDVIEVAEEVKAVDVIEAKPVAVPVKAPVYQAAVKPEPKVEKKVVKKLPRVDAFVAKLDKKSDYVSTTPQESAKGAISRSGHSQKVQASYHSIVHAILSKHKEYPSRALSRRQEGVVMVKFTIQKNGNISSYELTSSGYMLLDRAVEKLMKRVSPLPPFPDGLSREFIQLIVPIDFSIKT